MTKGKKKKPDGDKKPSEGEASGGQPGPQQQPQQQQQASGPPPSQAQQQGAQGTGKPKKKEKAQEQPEGAEGGEKRPPKGAWKQKLKEQEKEKRPQTEPPQQPAGPSGGGRPGTGPPGFQQPTPQAGVRPGPPPFAQHGPGQAFPQAPLGFQPGQVPVMQPPGGSMRQQRPIMARMHPQFAPPQQMQPQFVPPQQMQPQFPPQQQMQPQFPPQQQMQPQFAPPQQPARHAPPPAEAYAGAVPRQRPDQQQRGQPRQQQPPQQQQPVWHAPPPAEPHAGAVPRQRPDQQQRGQPRQQQPQRGQPQQPQRSTSVSSQLERLTIREEDLLPMTQKVGAKGSKGRRIRLEANYLAVQLRLGKAYHYDVVIDPDKPKKFLRPAFYKFRQEQFPNIQLAFDGNKNAYSAKPIAFEGSEHSATVLVNPQDGGREKEFKVTIKFATEVDLSCLTQHGTNTLSIQQALQCVDVVIRMAFNRPGTIQFRNSFFELPRQQEFLDDLRTYELFLGLYQSAVYGEKLYLNVDVSHKAFPAEMPLANLRDLYKNDVTLNQKMRGLDVVYKSPMTQQQTRYKFNELKGPANKETFVDDQDNQRKTIAQYFAGRGCRLRDENAPVIWVGSTVRNILLPIEHLIVPRGQALNRRAPDECTRKMVSVAATSAPVRKGKIMDLVRGMRYNGVPAINEFQLKIGDSFVQLDARILDTPKIELKNQKTLPVARGVWNPGPKDQFIRFEPTTSPKWGVINMDFRTRMDAIAGFGNMFSEMAQNKGMNLAPFNQGNVEMLTGRQVQDRDIARTMDSFKNEGFAFVFVVIPDNTYEKVKKNAELQVGILTQCIKANTIFRKGRDPSTVGNILLKVNAKLNGNNHKIHGQLRSLPSITEGGFMVVGADVTHPSPEQRDIPSVVGVTASYDQEAFRYTGAWRIQGQRQEMIQDLDQILINMLNVYRKYNANQLPARILYYRDGVSDGQFQAVMSIELVAIQNACKRIQQGYAPKITFIVVQKRHHTRFFPIDRNKDGRGDNVVPGTVVDTEITSRFYQQFFLASHAAIQGVTKPAKYCVLHDDKPYLTSDDLQEFTFNLCHMFARCNRAVSYAAPTYYAHLLAARGKAYIHNERVNFDKLDQENSKRVVRINESNPMFFT